VALVRTDVSEESIVPSSGWKDQVAKDNISTNYLTDPFHPNNVGDSSSEKSVLTRAIRHNILEGRILHSHRLANLKSSQKQIVLRNY
jgi:hypothetical protein